MLFVVGQEVYSGFTGDFLTEKQLHVAAGNRDSSETELKQ